jgi:hypothetical protein
MGGRTHEDAMQRCGFSLPNFDYCQQRTRMKYPGNDPENGPAREYCKDGHSTCYQCGKFFQAIEQVPEYETYYDDSAPNSKVTIPATSVEHDWCSACSQAYEKEHEHDVED